MRNAGHVASMGYSRSAHRVPVGRPEGKSHVEELGLDGKNNIKLDLQKMGLGGMDWISLAEDRERCLWLL